MTMNTFVLFTGKVKGKIRGLFRASPLFTTVLVGIRRDGSIICPSSYFLRA
jgi:hypothetical protein